MDMLYFFSIFIGHFIYMHGEIFFLHKLFDSEINKEQECQSSHKTYELQIYIIYK